MNHLNGKSVSELKTILKGMNMVNNISTLSKDQTINAIRSIETYKSNKQENYKVFNFGSKIVNLNDEQYKIVTANIPQNIRIIAAAGSGKTSTLICRIKYLIDHGIDPETIMVTSFNVDAAGTIKQRLTDLFGFLPKVEIGTFDGIACKLFYKYFRTSHKVSVSEYSSYLLKYLQTENNMVSNIYKYIFFDEFQDVGETQFRILKHFYDKGAYLTVIGDDAQNIYQFRGSDVRYILNLDLVIKNLKTYKLVNNYRSTPEIIKFANASIRNNTEQILKEMVPNHPSVDKMPTVKYFNRSYEQNKEILKQIIEMNKNGIPFDEIAILSRNNWPLKELEEEIEKYNCSDSVIKGTSIKIKYVALISDYNAETKPNIKPDHITMTTIHKAKGLEWQVVFLISASDDKFPSTTDKTSIQEERRLFYVAVTRSKKELFIYFSSTKKQEESNNRVKLSRFVQELDNSLYNFVNPNSDFYDMDNNRGTKKINAVTEMIQLINEKDMAQFRELGIIPTNDYVTTKLHDPYTINKFINTYYLHSDFGEFIDRYITRSIGVKKLTSGGLRDMQAEIIGTSIFEATDTSFCETYKYNFHHNLHKISKTTPVSQYLVLMNSPVPNITIKKIPNEQYSNLVKIITNILLISSTQGINISDLAKIYNFEVSLPDYFRKMVFASNELYKDTTKQSKDILKNIYDVSLCRTISEGRRRLVYRHVHKFFIDDYTNLFSDIDNKYIPKLDPKNTNLKCKPMISNDCLEIVGEPDLIDYDNEKIVDFKCSQTEGFKVEWILQLLAYYSIMKLNNSSVKIKFLEIYNPLKGELYTLDISTWTQELEYLKLLSAVRDRQDNRTKEPKDSKNFPIEYDDDDQIDPIEQQIIRFSQIVNNSKLKMYDMRMFGEDYQVYLKYLNTSQKYQNIIQKFNIKNNRKYIVLDTETTGLPKQLDVTYPVYTDIKKYDDSRMIQLCWAIYDYGKLVEVRDFYIKPDKWTINNSHIHNITNKDCLDKGVDIKGVLNALEKDLDNIKYIVGHNVLFDKNIILSETYRYGMTSIVSKLNSREWICTMEKSLPLKVNGNFARCKLVNLYKFLFGKEFDGQHNAKYDVLATGDVFRELLTKRLVNL